MPYCRLPRNSNQARGIAEYALELISGREGDPPPEVLERVEQFHRDSVACALAALGCGASAPRILREEALEYRLSSDGSRGARCFASDAVVSPEKAVLANCAAVRELDANGTNFGYNARTGNCRGEFGHNDFYPVAVAAAQVAGRDGGALVRAMLCLDEIRGRLAEVFALKDHKIDHVVHGAIASAAVYGALLGASVDQIESGLGLTVAHFIPFRAIRAGHQLSDSKGASAAISAEVAVQSVRRAMKGFLGPADIFRNPQAIFCLFEPPGQADSSPFDLELASGGSDFAVMGMHFKLGLYEHQSAGAIQGLVDLLSARPELLTDEKSLRSVRILVYEPAFSIIGDPAKRDPRTRQSADHSMLYIIATLLRKALEQRRADWDCLMLMPQDYDDEALFHPLTRRLMERIELAHGGPEFDCRYPDGIPTTIEIDHATLGRASSGLVMYPLGHARHPGGRLAEMLDLKFRRLADVGRVDADAWLGRLRDLSRLSAEDVQRMLAPIDLLAQGRSW